jgi:hypothetical protein
MANYYAANAASGSLSQYTTDANGTMTLRSSPAQGRGSRPPGSRASLSNTRAR